VEESQRPRAPVVYEIVRREGERELTRPLASLWWSGVAAGISIGFSFIAQAALAAYLPPSDWSHPVAALGYSAGFLIVILGRQHGAVLRTELRSGARGDLLGAQERSSGSQPR
ncbi:MAG: formate/nitrite transporter family protein, partial [Rhodomicrobium sp.]